MLLAYNLLKGKGKEKRKEKKEKKKSKMGGVDRLNIFCFVGDPMQRELIQICMLQYLN